MTRSEATEREWQHTLEELLDTFGYAETHTYPLRTQHGWRTPSTSPGFPDLLAVREPRLLAIECKRDGQYPDPAQRAWLTLFSTVPCARAWVLRPGDDWQMIVSWVRHPQPSPRVYGFTPVDDPLQVIAQAQNKRRAKRTKSASSSR